MQMIDGAMQHFALTLDKILEHAAKWHPRAEVVTRREDGRVDRVGYADLEKRARKVSVVLRGLHVRKGDRVATLAWNTQAHLEVWYAIIGMGAICHTLNPRLICSQLADMVRQSGAGVLFVSADLLPLARSIAEIAHSIECLVLIDDAPDAERHAEGSLAMCSPEPLIASAS